MSSLEREESTSMAEPLTREELLVLVIEEASEVIKAATKCLRFGWDNYENGYGANDIVLAQETGDLMGVLDALPLDRAAMDVTRRQKIEKAQGWKDRWIAAQPTS